MVRVMRRDGLGEEEVRRRMGAQPTAQEYVSHANVVICTQWDYSVTQKQVCAWCRCLHVFGSILCVCILCVCLRVCVLCVCVCVCAYCVCVCVIVCVSGQRVCMCMFSPGPIVCHLHIPNHMDLCLYV